MRGFFNGLIVGIVLGAVGYWFIQKKAQEHPEAQQRYEQSISNAGTTVSDTAHNVSDAFKAKLDTLDLNSDQIKDELSRTGKVVRRKAEDIGEKVADETSDARAVTEIKAKYAMDKTLSAWSISVSCSQGHVALSGTVSSADDIGRAVALALEADGVRDVTSTLTVKSNP
jgi:hyperosmotically inducible periplasmic protein